MRKLLLIGFMLLAACVPNVPPPPTLTPGMFAPALRDAATATPVAWVESSTALTADSAAQVTRLGRLDAPGTASTIFAYAFAPNGARLVGVNNDQLTAWNLLTGERLFATDRAGALSVYYAPDKDEIYTLDDQGSIRIFEADTGAAKDILAGHSEYGRTAAYFADDGWLALAGSGGDVKVWDAAERAAVVTLAGSAPVAALAFSPDGETLAVAGADSRVIVWDWRSRQPLLTIDGLAHRLAFSPDGTQLAVAQDSTIELFTLADGQRAHQLITGPGGSRDVLPGAQLAVAQDSTIELFTLADGQRAHQLITGPGGSRDVLLYSPDGAYLINGGSIPALMVWDAQTGDFVNNLPGVGGDSVSAAFSPDGSLLATAVLGGAVTLWNMAQINAETLTRADLDFGAPQALYVDWSPDGFVLIIVEAAGTIQVWGVP